MKMNVSEFAKRIRVSVRTLHYYDEIGLLKPDFTGPQNGYRVYGRMQEILFYRELHFSLKAIQEIISSPSYNKREALEGQKQLLLLKRKQLNRIIEALERAEKGETEMDFETFNRGRSTVIRRKSKGDGARPRLIGNSGKGPPTIPRKNGTR